MKSFFFLQKMSKKKPITFDLVRPNFRCSKTISFVLTRVIPQRHQWPIIVLLRVCWVTLSIVVFDKIHFITFPNQDKTKSAFHVRLLILNCKLSSDKLPSEDSCWFSLSSDQKMLQKDQQIAQSTHILPLNQKLPNK